MKIILLGSQGSGKSTQAKMLAAKLGVPYIEMGQLLRDKVKEQNVQAADIKQALESGVLVPDKITIKLLTEQVSKPKYQSGFVLDGYPRNYAQLEGLPKGIDKVFAIRVSDQEAVERLIGRGRNDDSLDLITKRLEIFHQDTEPLLAYFKQAGILEEVDGERQIEEIANDIMQRTEKS